MLLAIALLGSMPAETGGLCRFYATSERLGFPRSNAPIAKNGTKSFHTETRRLRYSPSCVAEKELKA